MVLQDDRSSSMWSETILACIERGPGEESWAEICHHLPVVEMSGEKEEWLEERLSTWPEEIRVVPEAWAFRIVSRSRTPEALRFCRRLTWSRHIGGEAPIGPEGAFEIAASSGLSSLRRLALRSHGIGDEGLWALASSANLGGVTHLDLDDNGIGDEGVTALAQSPYLRSLRHLNLWSNQVGPEGARAFERSGVMQTLTSLNLRANALEGRGCAALAGAPSLKNLRTLDLGFNRIGVCGARGLGSSTSLGRLENLDLIGNGIGDAGLSALMGACFVPRLTSLDLRLNRIEDRGLFDLLDSPRLLSIKNLRLSNNKLTDEGGLRLLDSPLLALPEGLDLRSNLFSRPLFARLKEKQRELRLLREAPVLERQGLLERKNLPLSYRVSALLGSFPYLPPEKILLPLLEGGEDPRLVALSLELLTTLLPSSLPPGLFAALTGLTEHPEGFLASRSRGIVGVVLQREASQRRLEEALFS